MSTWDVVVVFFGLSGWLKAPGSAPARSKWKRGRKWGFYPAGFEFWGINRRREISPWEQNPAVRSHLKMFGDNGRNLHPSTPRKGFGVLGIKREGIMECCCCLCSNPSASSPNPLSPLEQLLAQPITPKIRI